MMVMVERLPFLLRIWRVNYDDVWKIAWNLSITTMPSRDDRGRMAGKARGRGNLYYRAPRDRATWGNLACRSSVCVRETGPVMKIAS